MTYANALKDFSYPPRTFGLRDAPIDKRQCNVLAARKVAYQVEVLKYKSDLSISDRCPLVRRKGRYQYAVQGILAGARRI